MKNIKWIITIFILTFVLSCVFSGASIALSEVNLPLMIVILCIVVLCGIVCDMMGVAVLSGNEATFHAMASKKIKGAREGVNILRRATKVSSICCDVIGDICGIVSGAIGATLALTLASHGLNITLASIIVSAVISTVTVGGKAIAKEIAVQECDRIVFFMARVRSILPKRK